MGGPQANLSAEESITAMRKTIDNMTPDDNGVYRGYTGEIVAW